MKNIILIDFNPQYGDYTVIQKHYDGNEMKIKERPHVKYNDVISSDKFHFNNAETHEAIDIAELHHDPYLRTFVKPLADFQAEIVGD